MAQTPSEEGLVRMTLQPADPSPHGAQSILATERAAEAVEAAAAIGEARHHGRLSGHGVVPDTIVIEKSAPVSLEEAAMLESVTAATGGWQIAKGSVAAHAQSAAAKMQSCLEIPVNQEVAQKIQSLTSHLTESGAVPKESFAAEVKSAADRLEQAVTLGPPATVGFVRLTLQPRDSKAHGMQSALATEQAAEAIEAAAARGEALLSGQHLSGQGFIPDTIVIEKSTPFSEAEAAMLESVESTMGEGWVPKGSVAAHAQSAAARGGTRLEIPLTQEVARVIQSLTAHTMELGRVPKGSFASEVKSAVDRLEQLAGTQRPPLVLSGGGGGGAEVAVSPGLPKPQGGMVDASGGASIASEATQVLPIVPGTAALAGGGTSAGLAAGGDIGMAPPGGTKSGPVSQGVPAATGGADLAQERDTGPVPSGYSQPA